MRRAILCATLICLIGSPALAQTGLGVEVGILLPNGDFGDQADPSPVFGANWEIQDINALGQVAALSFMLRGSYAIVRSSDETDQLLSLAGQDADNGGLLELGAGARAYSVASPFFVSAGAHYAKIDPIGGGDSLNGWGGYGGIGLRLGPPTIKIDLEGRFHFLVPEEGDNSNYFTLVAGAGFPF